MIEIGNNLTWAVMWASTALAIAWAARKRRP